MVDLCKRVAGSTRFQHLITAVILFAGVLVGAETYPEMVRRYGVVLHTLDLMVLVVFVAEVMIKIVAEGRRPWRYFQDGWNVFDFIIVAACFMPVGGQYVTVLRLARLLRVLKLVRALPNLQLLVGALLKSIPSMGYVSLLLFLLFYVYGVAGVFLFAANDPVHFPDVQTAMLSLFRIVTLEDWTDVMYTQTYGCDVFGYGMHEALCTRPRAMPVAGTLYFVSFVLVGTMIVLNLFIGVIMNGMNEAQAEQADLARKARGDQAPTLSEEIEALRRQLADIEKITASMARRAAAEERAPSAGGREAELAPAAE